MGLQLSIRVDFQLSTYYARYLGRNNNLVSVGFVVNVEGSGRTAIVRNNVVGGAARLVVPDTKQRLEG